MLRSLITSVRCMARPASVISVPPATENYRPVGELQNATIPVAGEIYYIFWLPYNIKLFSIHM